MRSAQVYRWQIPMDAGVVLRDRRLKTRDGLYVCLREGEREGWGEISPLPGFSQETWEEAQSVLLAWVNNWLAGDCELPQMPSVAFGVSCALAELTDTLPQAANYRAAPLCNGDPDDLILKLADMPGEKVAKVKVGLYEAVRDGMVVNLLLEAIPDLHLRLDANSCALAELTDTLPQAANYRAAPLCNGDPDDLILKLADMPGEKVAKVKVGLYEAVRDGMVVNLLLEAIPDLHLRLDANRAWTPLKGQQFAKYVNPDYRDRIAFLEEPCKTRDDSRAFARETGIAIAWDESLREPDFAFVAEEGVRAVVIKPTLTGSLEKVREQVQAAHALGLTAVISSSIESSLGLTQLARIAAWLTPDTIPGLDTLDLMQAQQVRRWPGSTLPVVEVDALERLL